MQKYIIPSMIPANRGTPVPENNNPSRLAQDKTCGFQDYLKTLLENRQQFCFFVFLTGALLLTYLSYIILISRLKVKHLVIHILPEENSYFL